MSTLYMESWNGSCSDPSKRERATSLAAGIWARARSGNERVRREKGGGSRLDADMSEREVVKKSATRLEVGRRWNHISFGMVSDLHVVELYLVFESRRG